MNDSMWMKWLARHTWIFQNKNQSLASPRVENKSRNLFMLEKLTAEDLKILSCSFAR